MGRFLIVSPLTVALVAAGVSIGPPASAAGAAAQSGGPPPASPPAPFRATGNEPGWRLDIADGTLTLLTDLGKTRTVMPAPRPTMKGGTRTYAAADGGHAVTASITDTICVDTMSGMPHPNTVVVTLDGRTMNGCGGEPATLLHGEWRVESLAGAPPVKGPALTITFDPAGRVFGTASCNRFTGGFTLTGESLTIQQPAATMMACVPDEVMKQEDLFLKLLGSVTKFSTDGKGLTLTTTDGRTITSRRS
jgi:heat shock protein HslJ